MKLFSSKKDRNKAIAVGIILLIVIILAIYFCMPLFNFLLNKEQAKIMISSFGIYGPIILIALIVIVMMFGFIPDHPLLLLSGYLYGSLFGVFYGILGLTIGGIITFSIARALGRPFVEKVIDKQTMIKFNEMCNKDLKISLFILFLLPALPNDAFCYLAGLTNIKFKSYLLIIFLGRLPGVLTLAFLGNQLSKLNLITNIIIILIIIIGSVILLIKKKKVESVVKKQLNKFNKKHK